MSELQRLKGLLPPEMQSWVFVEASAAVDPPLISIEEIGRDEIEIQLDLQKWDALALDHRNLLFWHEVGRIQNDTVPRDGWEMAALAIGLGGAIGELWVQDGLLLIMAMGLSGFADELEDGLLLVVPCLNVRSLAEVAMAHMRVLLPGQVGILPSIDTLLAYLILPCLVVAAFLSQHPL
jgi:hypothetical protein